MKQAIFFDALLSGNDMVDSQHRELIAAINALYKAIEEGQGIDGAKKTLDFLEEYTNFHFGCEESLMRAKKYPLYTEHKQVHDNFVKTVQDLYGVLEEKGATEEFGDLVEKEVTDWLVNHIQIMDRKMTDWIKIRTNGMMDNML